MTLGAALVGALLWTVPGEAGKISDIGANCSRQGAKRKIDADGQKDMCVESAAIACPAGKQVALDRQGDADRCVVPDRADDAGSKPTCPAGLKPVPRPGADSCERAEQPVCRKKFRLKVQSGEDRCQH